MATYGSPPPTDPAEAAIQPALQEAGLDVTAEPVAMEPQYKVMSGEKIPVSKHLGSLWKGRIKAAEKARKKFEDAWCEAVKYYQHDQLGHRQDRGPDRAGNRPGRQLGSGLYETENLVFSNTSVLLPRLYPKNPRVEVTANTQEGEAFAPYIERLLNNLIEQKEAPGLNLKPKTRRLVLSALLTNLGWLMIGYNNKEEAAPQTQQELMTLATQYENAKDQATIKEIEGKLKAIEEATNLLDEAGPFVRFFKPDQVVVDPTHCESDFSDAGWMAYWEMVPTALLRAKYMNKEGTDQYKSIYKPTHVVSEGKNAEGEDDFTIFDTGKGYQAYGYTSQEAFEANCMTKCWYIQDKSTRRIFMFHDKDWTWPLWVWDDPLKLPRFFTLFPLRFHEDMEGGYSKGEVTYYLDQQDAINEMLSEERLARRWVMRHVMFDKGSGIDQATVDKWLKGEEGTAIGVDLPEGKKFADVLGTIAPPAMQFKELFDPTRKLEAVARISSVNEVARGAQFKTNTTNDAIAEYNSRDNVRFGERVDAIEDVVGEVMRNIGYLVLERMPAEEVNRYVTLPPEMPWRNIPIAEQRKMFTMKIVGGSSQKPTSETKKEEALKVGQILGQFASATPAAVLVALKVFERAFPEVVINKEDWAMIHMSIQQQMAPEPAPVEEPKETNGSDQAEVDPEQTKQIRDTLSQLPPQARQQLQALIDEGMSPQEALQRVQQGAL